MLKLFVKDKISEKKTFYNLYHLSLDAMKMITFKLHFNLFILAIKRMLKLLQNSFTVVNIF